MDASWKNLMPEITEQTIGGWTVSDLVQFLNARQSENKPLNSSALTCESLSVTEKAVFIDQLQVIPYVNIVGGSGAAAPLPANPAGYFKFLNRSGTTVLVPFYNA
jgi:hypothetical protein